MTAVVMNNLQNTVIFFFSSPANHPISNAMKIFDITKVYISFAYFISFFLSIYGWWDIFYSHFFIGKPLLLFKKICAIMHLVGIYLILSFYHSGFTVIFKVAYRKNVVLNHFVSASGKDIALEASLSYASYIAKSFPSVMYYFFFLWSFGSTYRLCFC